MEGLPFSLREKMFIEMLRIRMAEEKLIELWHLGQICSLIHLSIGQEAIAVGICNALDRGDLIFSGHRCHAHYLAKGGSLKEMYAELAGKTGGCSRGRGGSMHLFNVGAGVFLSVPLVGGTIPICVGTALSAKYKNIGRVSVAFFGDGAVEEGVFWESLNFASLLKLSVVFVCENNWYATHSPLLRRQPNIDISSRMVPHGVYSTTVDGNDVEQIFIEGKKMIDRARNGNGPSFMEARTYRLREHWGPGEDWHLGYRSREEGDVWREKCPIRRLRSELGDERLDFEVIEKAISTEIAEAVAFAKESPKSEREGGQQW